jgi:hypothetical protein
MTSRAGGGSVEGLTRETNEHCPPSSYNSKPLRPVSPIVDFQALSKNI